MAHPTPINTSIMQFRFIKVFFIGLLMLGFQACQSSDNSEDTSSAPELTREKPALKTGAGTMPEFTLETLDGKVFDSSKQDGRVLVVNFWATWCAPCREEIPDLVELQNDLGGEKFDVVGISMDEEGDTYVKEFADAMDINYPIMIDNGNVAEAFGNVFVLPTTFVIDKSGKITHRTFGIFPAEKAKADLEELIAAD